MAKKRRPAKSAQLTCANCDGGLRLEDPSYGLTCPRCGIRVAGPFTDASEIPDYLPAPLPSGHSATATITFKNASARRDYLDALQARLAAAGYTSKYIDDMIAALRPGLVIYVFGRDDAERAVDVAGEVHGASAELS